MLLLASTSCAAAARGAARPPTPPLQASVQQHLDRCFAALKQRVIDASVAVHTQLNGPAPGSGGEGSGAPVGGGGGGGSDARSGQLLRAAHSYLQELLQRGLAALLQVRACLAGVAIWLAQACGRLPPSPKASHTLLND